MYWLVFILLYNLAAASGTEHNPFLLAAAIAGAFYYVVVVNPHFPYPNGKVTWPWKKQSPSGKS
jgi:hypothetical protein